jgi:SAM-dependent methyltransferase
MNAEAEIQTGYRFRFAANWARFLAVLDEARIADEETSLRDMLAVTDLQDRRVLDIGCGSGRFSLAARRLGAEVHSFDFDLQSVAIYNDQGWRSRPWWFVKFIYNRLPRLLKKPFVIGVSTVTHALIIIKYTIKLKPMVAIAPLLNDRREWGMSTRYDAVDWIGGFPYEFSRLDTLAGYLEARGSERAACAE